MATVSVAKIKIRRGSDFDRRQIILDNGELGYVTDTASRRLFVGDGSTRGGNPAGVRFYSGLISGPQAGFQLETAQVGDIVFNTVDSKLYCLTGVNLDNFPDYNNSNAYQFIGTRADNATIQYNTSNGALELIELGVESRHINNNVFNFQGGFSRPSSFSSVSVNVDNTTIKLNGSYQLYVDAATLNFASLNTTNQNINATGLGFDNLPTGTAGLPVGSNKLWLQPNTTGQGFFLMLI
jgi:hypothetical protein